MVRAVAKSWIKRTWKREAAGILLLFWLVWTTFLLMFSSIDRMTASLGIYGMVTPAIFMFAMGAFGFDAYLKHKLHTPEGK